MAIKNKNGMSGLDNIFSSIDNEFSDLLGETQKDKKILTKRGIESEKKVKKAAKCKVLYILGTDFYHKIYQGIIRETINVDFVYPGQLLLVQTPMETKEKLRYFPGKNVLTNQETTHFYSAISGIVCWQGKYIAVEPATYLEDDLDPRERQLNYDTAVIISGRVPPGIKIRAKGDIYVHQNLGDVEIYSEGNVFLINGITSTGKGKITAHGIVYAKFIENTNVRSRKSIVVEESIMHSHLKAEDSIEMVGVKQVLVGGEIFARNFVNCKVLGSENFTKTTITMGLFGNEKKEIDELDNKIKEVSQESISFDKKITALAVKKAEGTITEEESVQITEFKKKKENCLNKKNSLKDRMKLLRQHFEDRKKCRISVGKTIYPGVNIILNGILYNVNKELHRLNFTYDPAARKVKQAGLERKKIDLSESEDVFPKEKIFDEKKIRRSIKLSGKDMQLLFTHASEFLNIKSSNLIHIAYDKDEENNSIVLFFEVKPGEPKEAVKQKALKQVKFERVTVVGESVEECIKKGERILKLEKDKLDYTIIKKPKKGVFSIGQKKEYILEVFKAKIRTHKAAAKIVHGSFIMNNTPEGLVLKVNGPQGEGKSVEEEDIFDYLSSKGYAYDIQKKVIKQEIENPSGDFKKIGPRQKEKDLDGNFKLIISDNNIRADIEIYPPKKGGIFPPIEEIEDKIKQEAIVNYNLDKVKEFCIKDNIGKPKTKILIAQGRMPTSPVHPKVKFTTGQDASGDDYKYEDRIDLKEKTNLINVTQGQLLAVITPGKESEPGVDVFGKPISGEPLKTINLKAGKNIKVSSDGLQFTAAVDGYMIIDRDEIKIEDVYNIKGDVDYSTGNIQFMGTVVIKGIVKDGFKVEAQGDVFAEAVEAAQINAEGNIIIKSGVMGRGQSLLKCNGRFEAKFVEQANIEAKGDVIVEESIMHSTVLSASNIIVLKGKNGLIVGGKVMAKNIVAAKNIGSKVATITKIQTGRDPLAIKILEETIKEYNKLKNKYEFVKTTIKKILKETSNPEELTPENKKNLAAATKEHKKLEEELPKIARSFKKQREDIKVTKGFIFAKEKVYTNIDIRIGKTNYKNMREIDFCTFFLQEAEIRYKEYDETLLSKFYKPK